MEAVFCSHRRRMTQSEACQQLHDRIRDLRPTHRGRGASIETTVNKRRQKLVGVICGGKPDLYSRDPRTWRTRSQQMHSFCCGGSSFLVALDENGTREHDRDPHREEPGREAHECTATIDAGWCVARRTTEHREPCSGTVMDSRRRTG